MAGIIVGVAHFVSSQNSVWLKMILYLFGGVNASSIDTTLIAEYAYRAPLSIPGPTTMFVLGPCGG